MLRYCVEGHARDGRGLTRSSIRLIVRTTKHVRHMARHAKEHHDLNVRRTTKKFIRRLAHADQTFQEIAKCAKALRGNVQRAGRRKADDQRMDQEAEISINRQFSIREIKSRKSIKAYGRSLKLCTASDKWARHYYKEIKEFDSKLWCLFKDSKPYGLIKTHDGIVEECSRRKKRSEEGIFNSNRHLNISRSVALNVLRAIGANGDDEKSFARCGAFHAFLNCAPKATTIKAGKYRYWIWMTNSGREILMARRRRPGQPLRWSHFTRSRKGRLTGGTCNAMSAGELAGLMLDHPALVQAIVRTDAIVQHG